MHPIRLAVLAVGCALSASQAADWLLNDYATLAADSAAVNKVYGIQTYSNKTSLTSLSVPEAGILRLGVLQWGSEGTEGYSANLGILHPFKKDWSGTDISSADTLQFEYRYDVKPKGLEVLIASKSYSQPCSDSGQMYMWASKVTQLAAVNTWKTVKIPLNTLTTPSWWSPIAGFPSLDAVLRNAQAIQIAPKTGYKDKGTQRGVPYDYCVTPNMPPINLDVRNIKLIGYEENVPNPYRVGCRETPVAVIDSAIDDNANEMGGYWFAYSDTSTSAAKLADSARGTSNISIALGAGAATLTAGLHKNTGDATFNWRPYAGWAAIGMNFEDSISTAFAGMTGIGFDLKAVNLGPNVTGVNFKVAIPGVSESMTHAVYLPAAVLNPASPNYTGRICIRPSDLKQPSWVKGAVPFKADSILQMAWEAKITDQSNPLIANDSAIFTVSNIAVYRDTGIVGVGSRIARTSFGARYSNGMLTVQPKAGFENISVVSPSGKLVARIQPGARSASVKLDRGTWFVVARNGKGESLTRKFVVMQ